MKSVPRPVPRPLTDLGIMLREFVRAPIRTGAVAPASSRLARAAAPIPSAGDPVVVELGPGTGPMTCAIQQALGGRGVHLAVESNHRLAALVEARWPSVTVAHEDAAHLRGILDRHGIGKADVIVSSLPWAAFSAGVQDRILGAVTESLAPNGVFTTYTYVHARVLPPARRFKDRLKSAFGSLETSPVVWWNLPPAVVFYARFSGSRASSS